MKLMTPKFLGTNDFGNCDNVDSVRIWDIAGHRKSPGHGYEHDLYL